MSIPIKNITITTIDGGALLAILGVGTAFYDDPDKLGAHVAAYHNDPTKRPWNGVPIDGAQQAQSPEELKAAIAKATAERIAERQAQAKSVAQNPPTS